nr:hypothetical protein CFP56_77549 [Quercus suber]
MCFVRSTLERRFKCIESKAHRATPGMTRPLLIIHHSPVVQQGQVDAQYGEIIAIASSLSEHSDRSRRDPA